MTDFHVLSGLSQPQVHLWRDPSTITASTLAYDVEERGLDANGLHLFRASLDSQVQEPAHALLRNAQRWEQDFHRKNIPREANYTFPADIWFSEGASRVLTRNPFDAAEDNLRIHLVTIDRYLDGRLMIWMPDGGNRFVQRSGIEESGLVFDVQLTGRERHLFLFKFVEGGGAFEPDEANRLWYALDGNEIWVLPHSSSIRFRRPDRRELVVRLRQPAALNRPILHIWQNAFLRQEDINGADEENGWTRFNYTVYTEFSYQFMFYNPNRTSGAWESSEAIRNIYLASDGGAWTTDGDGTRRRLGDQGVWTLEGDHELFGQEPSLSRQITLEIVNADPASQITEPRTVDVWVNASRGKFHRGLPSDAAGRWIIQTYPDVVTSFRFRSGDNFEQVDRHYLKVASADAGSVLRYVVLGRADPLPRRPVSDLFVDPPFAIARPGAWMADGFVRFAVHCPTAACVEVIGEWTGWIQRPLPMRSTRDGAYWWAQVAATEVLTTLNRTSLHGTLYKFLINQTLEAQDPAADWVENSDPSKASKLVDHSAYVWQNNSWGRPGWEYLIVYQAHPARFAQRGGTFGLDGITRELTDPNGYLRGVKSTALLLMPTCEFAGDVGWGYNPAFFYSVESAYGGPDALKRLVDACHGRGMAVLLDVVFNHAGASDNALWRVARDSFFDGDTDWGAMINFDHPQVIHFFERNLVHFMTNYRIDGFRFDFTRVIRFGDQHISFVKTPGSGGGWEFLRRLQSAVRSIDSRCLFIAENLPNDWDLTRAGGVMDSQWNDNFHDRMVDSARGWNAMPELADAMKITHLEGARWFESTNYPESHDEVGNEDNRISRLAGAGQGYRRNKVAAAATLLSRGIPMWFMGAESGEWRQFSKDGNSTLDLDFYERDESAIHIRNWWNRLAELRRGNTRIEGPSPIRVHYAQDRRLALSRGDAQDIFAILNFGDWTGWQPLAELNLPAGTYKELLNSTWGDYRIASEGEVEISNGGWDAYLDRSVWLRIPPYGVVILERR